MNYNSNILIVEDNPGDARLFRELLNDNIPHNIYVAKDGEMAIQMLHKEGKYSKLPRPDLILLDMNLPIKNGKDVLSDIKQDNELDDIPIVILTGYLPDIENHPCDKWVDAAFFKPSDIDGFNEIKKSIVNILNKKNKILIN
jgi:two-component system, chemotaxis family, response regulator Rcp1